MLQRRDPTEKEIKRQNDYADSVPHSLLDKLLADRESITVERCLEHRYGIDYTVAYEVDCSCGWIAQPDKGDDTEQWKNHVRTLLPDPDWLGRKLLEARQAEVFWRRTHCTSLTDELERDKDLDRQLKALAEVKK